MSELFHGVAEVLRQGEILLLALDDTAYRVKIAGAFNASVGGHYRHCLDHFQSLLTSLDADEVNYDLRQRDPRIETDRQFAMSETRRIAAAIDSIPAQWLTRPILVRSLVSYGGDATPAMSSSIGRELMVAISHTIHHYALIGVMCGLRGVATPAGFGVAPSTLKYQSGQANELAACSR